MYDRDAVSQTLHPLQDICSGFLESLDQLLRVEGVESMGDVIAALLSAQSHLRKNPAVFVHQAQQFDHVLCRIEGEVRLHQFQNPLKFSSDHLLLQTVTDKSVPQLIKS